MTEFYMVIVRKIVFHDFWGHMPPAPPSPTPMFRTKPLLMNLYAVCFQQSESYADVATCLLFVPMHGKLYRSKHINKAIETSFPHLNKSII